MATIDKQIRELIDKSEDLGIIHQTRRNFASMKTLSFVSLQLDLISHECVHWVLTSLRNDEMTPTERAIQSRIKEAFAFKINSSLWECLMESMGQGENKKNEDSAGHRQVKDTQGKMKVVTVKEYSRSKQKTYNDYYTTQKQN